jgi:hypothetical protein
MPWVWSEARKARVAYIVGNVLLPYLSRWMPGLGKYMTTKVSFAIANAFTTAPIFFALPMWVLVAIVLLVLGSLLANISRPLGSEVHVCTYCLKIIGPFGRRMVLPGRPDEWAHPRCYARNNQTRVGTPTGRP